MSWERECELWPLHEYGVSAVGGFDFDLPDGNKWSNRELDTPRERPWRDKELRYRAAMGDERSRRLLRFLERQPPEET